MVRHSFAASINDDDNIKAEEIVHEELTKLYKGHGATITNIAEQHRKWDFVITDRGLEIRGDAKFDANYEKYGRLPFEFQDSYPRGGVRPTWGVHPGLDFIAVVPWTMSKVVMVPLGSLGRYVAYKMLTTTKEQLESAEGWKWWQSVNFADTSNWTTHGVAVPEVRFAAFLEAHGESPLLTLNTDSKYHRDHPQPFGRLLVNGVDVQDLAKQNRRSEVS